MVNCFSDWTVVVLPFPFEVIVILLVSYSHSGELLFSFWENSYNYTPDYNYDYTANQILQLYTFGRIRRRVKLCAQARAFVQQLLLYRAAQWGPGAKVPFASQTWTFHSRRVDVLSTGWLMKKRVPHKKKAFYAR